MEWLKRLGWRRPLLLLVSSMVGLLLAEVALHAYFALMLRVLPSERNFNWLVGWKPAPFMKVDQERPSYGTIHYTTQEHGFRVFGNVHSKRKKILVLGDSFTQAIQVSDGDTYYHYLSKHSDQIEIFAFGADGYGSLQEYLVLEQYIDQIKPDLILWQFSSNDLVNNSHALESASHFNNNHTYRPYYQHGKMVFAYPHNLRYGLLYNLGKGSHIGRLLHLNLGQFRRTPNHAKAVEDAVEVNFTASHPLVVEAVEATREIMKMTCARAGPCPIVAFMACYNWRRAWSPAALCEEVGWEFIAGIPEAIAWTKAAGEQVDGGTGDPHWNAAGHAIAGRIILDYLQRQGQVPSPKPR